MEFVTCHYLPDMMWNVIFQNDGCLFDFCVLLSDGSYYTVFQKEYGDRLLESINAYIDSEDLQDQVFL